MAAFGSKIRARMAGLVRTALFAGLSTVGMLAVPAQAQVVGTPIVPPAFEITDIVIDVDKALCIRAKRIANDQQAKQLRVLFEWSDDPSCTVSMISVDAGEGERWAPGLGATSCPPNANLPPGLGDRLASLAINPPLGPGDEFARCIADTHATYWTDEQIAIARVMCSGEGPSFFGGLFLFQYDVTTSETLHVSEALIGQCAPPTEDGPEPLPACSDGVDNDEDGAVDYPADSECSGPDDDEEGPEQDCLPNLGRKLKRLFYNQISTAQQSDLGPSLQRHVGQTVDAKLRILRYLRCADAQMLDREVENLADRFLVEICLVEPAGQGLPEVCPPLDCPIDGPGCMDPYPYRRAQVSDEAVAATALWAAGFIDRPALDTELSRLAKAGQIQLEPRPPDRRRQMPHLGLGVGLGLTLLMIGVGVGLGRLVGRRRA